jgi:hypothetical protein
MADVLYGGYTMARFHFWLTIGYVPAVVHVGR